MESVFALIFFFAILILIVVFASRFEKKKVEEVATYYKQFAEKFGLDFFPQVKNILSWQYPKVVGYVDELQIALTTYKTGGKNKTVYTSLVVRNKVRLPSLKIVKEGFFQKIGKKFGSQDILIGDTELDQLYVFKSSDESALKNALSSEVQTMLKHLHKDLLAELDLTDGVNFKYVFIGHVDTRQKIETLEQVTALMLILLKNLTASKSSLN